MICRPVSGCGAAAALRFLCLTGPQGSDGLTLPALIGLLLPPIAAAAGALAASRFGVDAGWTGRFSIGAGVLSHCQVWGAFAASAEIWAWRLRRSAAARVPAGLG
jgi:hypothetical protein